MRLKLHAVVSAACALTLGALSTCGARTQLLVGADEAVDAGVDVGSDSLVCSPSDVPDKVECVSVKCPVGTVCAFQTGGHVIDRSAEVVGIGVEADEESALADRA
jgi:hypothetical protein